MAFIILYIKVPLAGISWLLMSFIQLLSGYSHLLLTAGGTGDTAAVKKGSSKHVNPGMWVLVPLHRLKSTSS